MSLIEKLSPDFTHIDDRGSLTQLVHEGYNQVNAVFTKKGAVRGNYHYHKNNDEVFYVISGEIKVSVYLGEEKVTEMFSDGDMFKISHNIRHDFQYLKDTYLVVLYPDGVENEDGTKDIFTD